MLSCSSDCNVTITNILTSAVVRQFRYHDDHVTCLSPVSSTGTFVSAGLDGYCCLWDAEVGGGGHSGEHGTAWSAPMTLLSNKKRTSIYCADLSGDSR